MSKNPSQGRKFGWCAATTRPSPAGADRVGCPALLQGDKVKLAPLRREDIPVLFAWANDREQVLYASRYAPVHFANHEAWFENVLRGDDVVIFGLRRRSDDGLIGYLQLKHVDPQYRSAELQVRLGEVGEREQGYGTEALALLLRHAFEDLNLWRVSSLAFATNERSIHVLEKVGFRQEGRLRDAAYIDGRYVDLVALGVLRSDLYPSEPDE